MGEEGRVHAIPTQRRVVTGHTNLTSSRTTIRSTCRQYTKIIIRGLHSGRFRWDALDSLLLAHQLLLLLRLLLLRLLLLRLRKVSVRLLEGSCGGIHELPPSPQKRGLIRSPRAVRFKLRGGQDLCLQHNRKESLGREDTHSNGQLHDEER